jgi:transposase-like protein
MNPQELFCPNFACPARGQCGEGNIIGHGRKKPRFKCQVCRQTFSPTIGTPWHRLHYPASVVTLVVTLLAWGCPVPAIVRAFGLDERTVQAWQARARQPVSGRAAAFSQRSGLVGRGASRRITD